MQQGGFKGSLSVLRVNRGGEKTASERTLVLRTLQKLRVPYFGKGSVLQGVLTSDFLLGVFVNSGQ